MMLMPMPSEKRQKTTATTELLIEAQRTVKVYGRMVPKSILKKSILMHIHKLNIWYSREGNLEWYTPCNNLHHTQHDLLGSGHPWRQNTNIQ